MYIMGIHCGHDASAALVKDGRIIAVIQEERKARVKHQNGFPRLAIREVLRMGGITAKEVDFIAFAGNDRRIESVREFLRALRGRRFYSYTGIYKRFRTVVAENTKVPWKLRRDLKEQHLAGKRCFYFKHHLCHASSAYRTSGLEKALILTIDGVGDDVSATVNIADKGEITRISQTRPENSLGLMYQAVTEALGFVPVEGEYKTMGLAAYGDQSKLYEYFSDIIDCGNLKFKSKYIWESDWGFPAPTVRQHVIFKELLKRYKREDIAAGCQAVTEDMVFRFVRDAVERTHIHDVAASGGVFLNVKANKLVREKVNLKSFYVHPDSGDGGLALGGALELYFRLTHEHRRERLKQVYFGTEYSNHEIEKELNGNEKVRFSYIDNIEKKTAELLCAGKVIGWFQGRMEMGPRALGNRSVLADPRNPDVKEKINKHLKKREWFVPFAPSLLAEDAGLYVKDLKEDAPFMIMAYNADEDRKSLIQAVVHIDSTLRPQVVDENVNPAYWKLIKHFKELTGIGVLLNTSFNRHGLPIVESPRDAVQHLLNRNVDMLVAGNYLVERLK